MCLGVFCLNDFIVGNKNNLFTSSQSKTDGLNRLVRRILALWYADVYFCYKQCSKKYSANSKNIHVILIPISNKYWYTIFPLREN